MPCLPCHRRPIPVDGATSVRTTKGHIAFCVRLGDIGELFVAPEADPFEEQLRVTSGIDDIVAHLAAIHWKSTTIIEATVFVPASKVTNGLQVRTAAAVRRHCRHKHGEAAMNEARVRYESIAAMPRNFVIFGLSCSLWYGLQQLPVVSALKTMLSVIVAVLAWVPLWTFCDMMFVNLPHLIHLREQAIYQAVESMTITVESDPQSRPVFELPLVQY
jgi:hypothetical protein